MTVDTISSITATDIGTVETDQVIGILLETLGIIGVIDINGGRLKDWCIEACVDVPHNSFYFLVL